LEEKRNTVETGSVVKNWFGKSVSQGNYLIGFSKNRRFSRKIDSLRLDKIWEFSYHSGEKIQYIGF
jgi:hypothetical protein